MEKNVPVTVAQYNQFLTKCYSELINQNLPLVYYIIGSNGYVVCTTDIDKDSLNILDTLFTLGFDLNNTIPVG